MYVNTACGYLNRVSEWKLQSHHGNQDFLLMANNPYVQVTPHFCECPSKIPQHSTNAFGVEFATAFNLMLLCWLVGFSPVWLVRS